MGPEACQHQWRMWDKSEPYAHACYSIPLLPALTFAAKKRNSSPTGILCRANGRRFELLGVQVSNQCESPHPPPLFAHCCSRWGNGPILALIGLPATKYFCGARADDGLVRSVSSNFDFWASESNRMPMSLYVSNADQANK
jgi:hypothetical protein